MSDMLPPEGGWPSDEELQSKALETVAKTTPPTNLPSVVFLCGVGDAYYLASAKDTDRVAYLRADLVAGVGLAAAGIGLLAAERIRQVSEEGYDSAHDDQHSDGSIALAAAAYATFDDPADTGLAEVCWPHDWGPLPQRKSPIRNLVRAGALIAAEIDRRLRAGEDPAR